MNFYHYFIIYAVGFVVMFTLLIRGDKIHDLEFDLIDTLRTSLLWPFYVVAMICIIIYSFFIRKILYE